MTSVHSLNQNDNTYETQPTDKKPTTTSGSGNTLAQNLSGVNGNLSQPSVQLPVSQVREMIDNGYQEVDQTYIGLGNGYSIRIVLYLKEKEAPIYMGSLFKEENGQLIEKTQKADVDEANAYLERVFQTNLQTLINNTSYNTTNGEFAVNVNKITGNHTDTIDDGTETTKSFTELGSVYNKNDIKAIDIYNRLMRANGNENDIKYALEQIDNPDVFKKIEHMLAERNEYKSGYLYSVMEIFMTRSLSDTSAWNYSSPYLEKMVERWIANGVIEGEDAIQAQARLAARIIFDGADNIGTDEDVVFKGVDLIRAPVLTDNVEENQRNARKVRDAVNEIVRHHGRTRGAVFYTDFNWQSLSDYLEGDLNLQDMKFSEMLAETNGLKNDIDSSGKVNSVSENTILQLKELARQKPELATKVKVIENMFENLKEAVFSMYENGAQLGIFADMADTFSGLWNTKKKNPHGNKSNLVKDDLMTYYQNIISLVNSLSYENVGNGTMDRINSFEGQYLRIFGVEYNEQYMNSYFHYSEQEKKYQYVEASMQSLNSHIQKMGNMTDEQYIEQATEILQLNKSQKKAIKELAAINGVSLKSVYRSMLNQVVSDMNRSAQETMDKIDRLPAGDMQRLRSMTFGNGINGNIVKRVDDYNESQIKGAAIMQTVTEVAAFAAILVATGGSGAFLGISSKAMWYGLVCGSTHMAAEMAEQSTQAQGVTTEGFQRACLESCVEAAFGFVSEGMAENLVKTIGKKTNLGNSLAYKMVASSCKDSTIEFTKQLVNDGDIKKAAIRGLYASITKFVSQKFYKGNSHVQKYAVDKGSKRGLTGVTHSGFVKEFDPKNFNYDAFLEYYKDDPEMQKFIEAFGKDGFRNIVHAALEDLKNIIEELQENNKYALPEDNYTLPASSLAVEKPRVLPNWNN